MPKTDYKTIDEYHQAYPEELASRMQQIRDIIHKIVPAVEETISYQIPCFKYNGYLLYYAAYSQHISLSYPFSPDFLDYFAGDLRSYKVSKSAIQIPNKDSLPIKLITAIVKFRKRENDHNIQTKK